MAAGLGFKTFTTGEVLTAGDVNGYLMQGINVFASEAARNAAITSPQEGQFAFTKDNNSLWYYTGSAWVASGATGDIEGVTAGVGISGGGTSGTVTVTNSMATAIDAKGDLVPGTGADTFSRLAVGANGTVLTADSAEATGLKWAAASSGAMTLISTATVTTPVTTITFNSIPDTYTNLQILYTVYNPSGDFMRITFNNVNTNTYYSQALSVRGTSVGADENIGVASARCGVGNLLSNGLINIPGYKNTAMKKSFTSMTGDSSGTPSINQRIYSFFGRNDATTTISRLDIISPSNIETGSTFSLYGVN
jgi:hypothetical protein